jgi:hypothetical protein
MAIAGHRASSPEAWMTRVVGDNVAGQEESTAQVGHEEMGCPADLDPRFVISCKAQTPGSLDE